MGLISDQERVFVESALKELEQGDLTIKSILKIYKSEGWGFDVFMRRYRLALEMSNSKWEARQYILGTAPDMPGGER